MGRPNGLIASTDADTQVAAPTWLAATQAEIRTGADAVGGRILTIARRCGPGRPTRRIRLRDAAYHLLRAKLEHRLDPQPDRPLAPAPPAFWGQPGAHGAGLPAGGRLASGAVSGG